MKTVINRQYEINRLVGHFIGTLHVDKIHVRFKIANITHVPPVPDYQHDFTPKLVVVSRLHDTVAEFRTGVKFSFPLTLAMTTLNPSKVVF